MSLHKLSAGSGYDYLTRQVAVLDATDKGHAGLASYYTERGESPGVWVGSGMAGIDGLDVGDPVTAEQMRALFGCGLHPLAELRLQQLEGTVSTGQNFQNVMRLGAPFKIIDDATPFRVEVARRIAALNAAIGDPVDASVAAADRARIRTQLAREFFAAEHGRAPTDAAELAGQIAKSSRPRAQTVAGFDLTFSPVSRSRRYGRSPNRRWRRRSNGPSGRGQRCAELHRAAGLVHPDRAPGDPAGQRPRVGGGRVHPPRQPAGDPDLHTHVAVANKVQTLDRRWLSIDGRVLFKAKVAASETYNTSLEQHLRDALGVRFATRPGSDPGKRPIREIVGVDPRLNQRWSTRRGHINLRRGELAVQFQAEHGRPPTPVEALHLAQQATLETRDAKHEPRSLTEQRTTWMNEAAAVLGGRSAVASMVATALTPATEPPRMADAQWVAQTADRVLAAMEQTRSTWQMWHVRAEAQRHIRAADVPAEQANPLVDLLVDEVLEHRSVALAAPPEGIEEPGARCGGWTGRRSTPSPAPTSTPPSASSPPSNASSPPRDVSTDQSSRSQRWIWLCWRWRRTAPPWMRGKPPLSSRCAPLLLDYSWRSPRPAPGRPPRCVPSPWPGPKTAARSSASPPRLPPLQS
jgi:TrwC relaxase